MIPPLHLSRFPPFSLHMTLFLLLFHPRPSSPLSPCILPSTPSPPSASIIYPSTTLGIPHLLNSYIFCRLIAGASSLSNPQRVHYSFLIPFIHIFKRAPPHRGGTFFTRPGHRHTHPLAAPDPQGKKTSNIRRNGSGKERGKLSRAGVHVGTEPFRPPLPPPFTPYLPQSLTQPSLSFLRSHPPDLPHSTGDRQADKGRDRGKGGGVVEDWEGGVRQLRTRA